MATTSSLISLDDVYRARERIGDRLHRTPMLSSATLSKQVGADVRFKAELLQRTGAFKPRGVLNKLATLTEDEKKRGVISISAGNHAQALAYASALEGIDALVVMWQTASPMKIAAARGYGATIDTEAADIPSRVRAARRIDRVDGPHARPPLRRSVRDGGSGNRRPRDDRGRAGGGHRARPGRRRRPDLRELPPRSKG